MRSWGRYLFLLASREELAMLAALPLFLSYLFLVRKAWHEGRTGG
jgi:hypothetical protein